MKTLLIIVAILIVIIGPIVIVTYPRYSRESPEWMKSDNTQKIF
jgi:uncharacterized protein YxeA